MFERLKNFCDSFLEHGIPGFDLAVYKNGKSVLRYMNGYSDFENKIPVTGKERYNIYSGSKVITCTAALQLWEKGLFSLEDKLGYYMPEFREMTVHTPEGIQKATKSILIKHLFEMTAGFSYNLCTSHLMRGREETDGRCPTREMMKYLAQEPLAFEPGDRWEYSLCHDVLAAFVEVVSGMKFEDYVKKNIFDVLGMQDSTFMLSDDQLDTIAEQYRFEEGKLTNVGKSIVGFKLGSEYASGGAGGISTVDDYIKFLEGLRKFVLLKPETVQLMQTDRLTEHQKRTYWTQDTHGYGLGVRCGKQEGKLTDFGWGGAAGAYSAVDIENGISIYFGMHLMASPVQGIRSMIYRFVHAQLFDQSEFHDIYKELESLYDYNLTY